MWSSAYHVWRRLVDLPVAAFPTRLNGVSRYRCANASCPRKDLPVPPDVCCPESHRDQTGDPMNPSTSGPRSDECLLHRHSPGLGWQLVNQIALDAARRLVYTDSDHLDGVRVLGVDEHVWKHTHRPGEPDALVTVVVDLAPLDEAGPARLIDMRPGRSTQVLEGRLSDRDEGFRKNLQTVTMDGFPVTSPPSTARFPPRPGGPHGRGP